MKKSKNECNLLENLQTFLDDRSGSEMGEELKHHLHGPSPCLECRTFYDEYMEFRNIFGKAAEQELPAPNRNAPEKVAGQRFRIGLLVSAAALAMFFGSFYTIRSISRSRVIASDTKMYVEELLDSALFETSDYSSSIPEGWFDFSVTDSL